LVHKQSDLGSRGNHATFRICYVMSLEFTTSQHCCLGPWPGNRCVRRRACVDISSINTQSLTSRANHRLLG